MSTLRKSATSRPRIIASVPCICPVRRSTVALSARAAKAGARPVAGSIVTRTVWMVDVITSCIDFFSPRQKCHE
eukprot:890008-Prymnesium_polylepis.1